MMFSRAWIIGVCLLGLLLGAGCIPRGGDGDDELKDPHYLTGKSRENSLDYNGAVEAFEKALEYNPKHAQAHFELGILYEQRSTNYARAIYHFERFLDLRPNTDLQTTVRDHILACKQELARTVSLGPITREQQRGLERLTEENFALRAKVQQLQTELAQRPVIQVPAPGGNQPVPNVPPNPNVSNVPPPRGPNGHTKVIESNAGGSTTIRVTPLTPSAASSGSARTYTVRSGDTPFAIARNNKITTAALMAANPGLDAKKLKVGQVLNLPASSR